LSWSDLVLFQRSISTFYFNAETATNDFFQRNLGEKRDIVHAKALIEFDGFVAKLRSKGINVHVIQDDAAVFDTPDSIFAHNWFVSLEGGKLMLRPMFAEDRRFERMVVDELSESGQEVEKSSEILVGDVQTIEAYGGGSVRCMISEIF
jgi:hypothetical protein